MKLINIVTALIAFTMALPPGSAQKAKSEDASGEDKVYFAREVTRRAVIEEKREPDTSSECPDRGVVRVRVVLHKSGKVTEVKFIRKMSCGFDKNVREAARTIKFIPAMKDGAAVSQYATLEYVYTRY